MEAGAHVWVTDTNGDEAWLLAEVLKKEEHEIQVQLLENAKKTKVVRAKETTEDDTIKYHGVELANTKLSEEEKRLGRDNDLITLPHLHEPALLHAVSERFYDGKIYTWTGPILIAVNPFQRLPLYTSVSVYCNVSFNCSIECECVCVCFLSLSVCVFSVCVCVCVFGSKTGLLRTRMIALPLGLYSFLSL
jgi:hypothetical protein